MTEVEMLLAREGLLPVLRLLRGLDLREASRLAEMFRGVVREQFRAAIWRVAETARMLEEVVHHLSLAAAATEKLKRTLPEGAANFDDFFQSAASHISETMRLSTLRVVRDAVRIRIWSEQALIWESLMRSNLGNPHRN